MSNYFGNRTHRITTTMTSTSTRFNRIGSYDKPPAIFSGSIKPVQMTNVFRSLGGEGGLRKPIFAPSLSIFHYSEGPRRFPSLSLAANELCRSDLSLEHLHRRNIFFQLSLYLYLLVSLLNSFATLWSFTRCEAPLVH